MRTCLLTLAAALALNACAARDQSNAGQNSANAPTSNTNAAAPNNAAPANVETATSLPYNGIENLNPNAFNAARDNLKVVPNDANQNRLSIGTRTAPDDSTITATMNSKGQPVETRIFKSHPLLEKVEKTTVGREARYKVFLRNGKILEAPADQLENFAALAPENILDAVGLLPKPQNNQTRSADKLDPKRQ